MVLGKVLNEALRRFGCKVNESVLPDNNVMYSVSTDTRTLQSGQIFMAISGENFDGHDFVKDALNLGAPIVIGELRRLKALNLSAEEQKKVVAVDNSIAALLAIAKAHRLWAKAKILAVTGTAGKTTTKELIKNVLATTYKCLASAKSFNNQIGVPLTLLRIEPETDFCVVEIGINQVGEMEQLADSTLPDMSLITNIGMSHLSGLHDVDTVASEKGKLFEKTASEGTLFINSADRKIVDLVRENPRQKVNFSLQKTAEAKVFFGHSKSLGMGGWDTVVSASGQEYPLKIPHIGRMMLENSLAAVAVGHHMKVPMKQIEKGLAQKIFARGRGEIISLSAGRMLIDDSYNSNPLSMRAAIENLCALSKDKKKLVIVGDMLEQGEDSEKLHRQVGAFLKLKKIDAVIAVGEFAGAIDEGFADAGEIAHFLSPEEAQSISQTWASDYLWILVKGSRAMQMEKIVNLLTQGSVH